MYILGVTGHREIIDNLLEAKTLKFLELAKPEIEKVITGMAQGYDQLIAKCCLKLDIPYIAALPFDPSLQSLMWPAYDKIIYDELLNKASEVVLVNEGPFAKWKYHARDVYIVDHSDKMLVYYESETHKYGGTHNTIKYALRKEKFVFNLAGAAPGKLVTI